MVPPGGRSIRPAWMVNQHSLTGWLRAIYPHLYLSLLKITVRRPRIDEIKALGLRHCRSVCVREVLLCSDGLPLVYATTTWSVLSKCAMAQTLRHLGCRSIGETLFKGNNIYRSELAHMILDSRDAILVRLSKRTGRVFNRAWGRMSVVKINNYPIIIVEVSLNSVIDSIRPRGNQKATDRKSTQIRN